LFTEFNSRYDKLNEALNKIVEDKSGVELSDAENNTLNDYFNLCAEEFLFFKKGYIYPEVWRAWENGMLYYLRKNQRVRTKWEREVESGSYYGLRIKLD
jgi:hypothetical protein